MKNVFHPMLMITAVAVITLVATGCPVGIAYPLCEESQIEKVDKNLLGTWRTETDSAEIREVRIAKEDDITYNIEIMEKGETYMMDEVQFFSWATKFEGRTFLFSQSANNADDNDYYLYHIILDKKKLIIEDVSLLAGGMDAVTSTATLREEISASLKKPDCLTARIEYKKQ